MITPFTIFGFMINDTALHLHLSGRKVTLEILHIACRIPKTPLHEREEFEFFSVRAGIGKTQTLNLTSIPYWNKEQKVRAQSVFLPHNPGISHSVAAFIEIKRSLARLPPGIPDSIPVLYIKIPPAVIHRHAVIAIARNPAELGIATETIPTGSSGDKRKEILRAKIIYPRPGSGRNCYHIFPALIVKMSICFHRGQTIFPSEPYFCR